MLHLLLTTTLIFFTSAARATSDNNAFFTIDKSSLKIQEIDSGVFNPDQVQELIAACSDRNDSTSPQIVTPEDLAQLINYGKQIWKVVIDNKPVVNVTENTANALPKGVECWTDLEYWQAPKYKTYQITYENLFGIKVMDFKFQLFYSYGGKSNGKGNYLANVTVAPMNLDVLWGFQLNAIVEVGQILNVGSHDSPTAGMELTMKWEAKSPLKDSRGQVRYFVQGDGSSNLYD